MNYDNIVNLIVEEIYKKLNTSISTETNKPIAVTMFEDDNDKFDLIKNKFEVVGFNKDIKDCEIIVISKLCMRGLSNLANGNSTSDEERFILKMLMKGKKVYVLNQGIEYKHYKDTAPKPLYKKYIEFEDEIIKYGVNIIKDLSEVFNNIKSEDIKVSNSIEKETETEKDVIVQNEMSLDLTHKKLISESDLRKPTINGVKSIVVNKKSIITPLAADFLRIHHMKLNRK